jgi:GMP synthase-like glutamine amidotransferase
MLRVHVVEHEEAEGIGSIADWLHRRDAEVTRTQTWRFAEYPEIGQFDFLIVMGGLMSANDEASLPWLRVEKEFIREAIAAERAVLGICLGSQMIAGALGAKVRRNGVVEHGWFAVEGLSPPDGAFAFPKQLLVFHSHEDTFDLPPGSVHLARSIACEHQAFQLADRVIGLQFHLEATLQATSAIARACAATFQPGHFVQPAEALHARSSEDHRESATWMARVLDYLAAPMVAP